MFEEQRQAVLALESVQHSFTKHIFGMQDFAYKTLLSRLGLYSLQRRRERYLYKLLFLYNRIIMKNMPLKLLLVKTSLMTDTSAVLTSKKLCYY